MTRALTRTHFHSSRLIRVLADLAVVDAGEPGIAFAEKLGLWVEFTDAITLAAALGASTAVAQSGAKSGARLSASAEFARIRSRLVSSITRSCSPDGGASPMELCAAQPGELIEVATAFEPFRRLYLAQQRDMDGSVHPLRSHVRELLARASPALRQLATLDAAFDGILRERESQLLSTVPRLLRKRFEQLLKAHQLIPATTPPDVNPAMRMTTDPWLARFCHELQTVLLAELDLRLQPTVGLIEALNHEIEKHP